MRLLFPDPGTQLTLYRLEQDSNQSFYPHSIWGSHSGGYEDFYFIGFNAVKVKRCIGVTRRICVTLVSGLFYYPTMKTEATCSFETSVVYEWTTRQYISEDKTVLFLHILTHPWDVFPENDNCSAFRCALRISNPKAKFKHQDYIRLINLLFSVLILFTVYIT
jgi:hypothetical protein